MAVRRKVKMTNKLGMHARPAVLFSDTANKFGCEITVEAQSRKVDGKSIMDLMTLGATSGTVLEIIAEGDDAEKAVDALTTLVEEKFRED